jgi:hypothetical protein
MQSLTKPTLGFHFESGAHPLWQKAFDGLHRKMLVENCHIVDYGRAMATVPRTSCRTKWRSDFEPDAHRASTVSVPSFRCSIAVAERHFL